MIRLKIPTFAVELMTTTTPTAVFEEMVKNNGLTFQKMVTFGGVIWPINNVEEEAVAGYVIYWPPQQQISVCLHHPGQDFLSLAGLEPGNKPQTPDEAVEIFNRYYQEELCL